MIVLVIWEAENGRRRKRTNKWWRERKKKTLYCSVMKFLVRNEIKCKVDKPDFMATKVWNTTSVALWQLDPVLTIYRVDRQLLFRYEVDCCNSPYSPNVLFTFHCTLFPWKKTTDFLLYWFYLIYCITIDLMIFKTSILLPCTLF